MSPNNLVNTSRLYLHFNSFLSSKFGVVCIILLFLLITSAQQNIFAQVPIVSNEQITPLPVISYFDNYEFRVDVAPNGTTINGVSITSIKVNGEDSDHNNPTVSCDYYNNGDSYSDGPNVNTLSNIGGDTYSYGSLRPDNLYPEIFFTPNGVDYNNSPLDFRPNRNEYHILKFTNPFKMVDNSSLFIELYANPRIRRLSVDLQVYVVGNDEGIDFFQGDDWRSESSAELVGTIKRSDDYNHTHGPNAKHHVVRLLTNDDGTIGTKNINVDGSFWVVLMAPTRFRNRAWTLKYHPKEVNGGRDNDGLVDQALSANATWYRGNFSTWTTTAQSGLPCSHIHIVRDGTDGTDPVKYAIFIETSVDYTYNGTDDTIEETEIFYYNIVPDLPPNASSVIDPEQCAYSSTIDISWVPASDPNGDDLTYNVSVVDLDSKALVKSVATDISTTSVSNFDISDVANGFYDIEVEACDGSSCTPFYWTGRYSDDGDFLYLGDNGSLFRSTQSGTWTDYQNWEKNSGDCVWTPASSGEYPSANWAYILNGHSLTIDDGTTHSLDMYVEGHLSCDMNFTANKVIGLNDASISSSGDWSVSSFLPSNSTVTFTGESCAINTSNEFNQLVVQDNATLTIPSAIEVDVESGVLVEAAGVLKQNTGSTLNISGNLYLKSSTDINASYLPNGTLNIDSDSVFIEQIISYTGHTYSIASPVSGVTPQSLEINNGIYSWSNSTGAWQAVGATSPLSAGVGYICRSSNSPAIFTGAVNTATINVPLSRSEAGYGWNLIGNPFTASLNWDLLAIDGDSDIENSFWIWCIPDDVYCAYNTNSGLSTLDGGSVIPSQQAFFVKVKEGVENTSIDLTPTALVANAHTYLKSSGEKPEFESVLITGTCGESKDKAVVAINEDVEAYDASFSTEKKFGYSSGTIEIYSVKENEAYAINCTSLPDSKRISLGYSVRQKGSYGISVKNNTHNYNIRLIDTYKNESLVLDSDDVYEFEVEIAGIDEERFLLEFEENVSTEIHYSKVNSINCFVQGGHLLVKVPAGSGIKSGVIYDVMGSPLKMLSKLNEGLHNLGALPIGIYLVKLEFADGEEIEVFKVQVSEVN